MLEDKTGKISMRNLVRSRVGVGVIAGTVALLVGVSITVFPQSHPRGLVGLAIDGMSSISSAEDAPLPTAQECDNIEAGSDCDVVREQLGQDRLVFAEAAINDVVSVEVSVSERVVPSLAARQVQVKEFSFSESVGYYNWAMKPTQFITVHGDDFFLVAGDGVVLTGPVSGLLGGSDQTWRSIPSNLGEIFPVEVREPSKFSVKGAFATAGYLYVSASVNTVEEGFCWTTAVFRAPRSADRLTFEEFFQPNDCADPNREGASFEPHQSGGALFALADGRIAVGVGDYRQREKAQDSQSQMGGMVAVSPETGQGETLAKGLRNPQGVVFDDMREALWIVDQGPSGGDEVNFLDLTHTGVTNFGWPISSYGRHYGGREIEGAPLHKSHRDYGFEEPRWHWNPSSPVSSVMLSPKNWPGDVIVGVLGNRPVKVVERALHIFASSDDGSEVQLVDTVRLEDRVRSLTHLTDDMVLATLDSGVVAVLSIK